MYGNKERFVSALFLVVSLGVLFLTSFLSTATANENYGNLPPDPNMLGMLSLESIELPFDPNDYTFLVYDPGGGQPSIIDAIEEILGRELDETNEIRTGLNIVTANDLATHDILIVGWNDSGDTSGLAPNVLAAGINGKVILSGHDLDYHTVENVDAAQIMLIQAINYAVSGSGTGLVTLGCTSGFPYVPEEWGVSSQYGGGETVTEFTLEGLDSGVYDNLEPNNLCSWGQSYHDTFIIDPDSDFAPFELGGNGNDIITIGRGNILPQGCEVSLTIADDTNSCVYPFYNELLSDYLNYTICYSTTCDINDVNIIVLLSEAVNFNSCSDNGVYHSTSHTVEWNLGALSANQSDCLTVCVAPTEAASPGSTILSKAKIYSNQTRIKVATEQTPVCHWGGEIIYVDQDANGYRNGTEWKDAYKTLRDAFAAAQNLGADVTAIWVAAGTYKPVESTEVENYQNYSFELLEDVALFGHFAGTEKNAAERDFADADNETILEGQIGDNYYEAVYKVVSAANINSAVVDGFTIEGSCSNAGVYLDNSDISIANCKFKNNNSSGVHAYNYSYPDIHNCLFMDNSGYAIYSNTSEPDVSYSIFDGNDATPYGLCLESGSVSNITHSNLKNYTSSAIYGSSATVDIEDCKLSQNSCSGVEGSSLNLSARRTVFESNGQYGIRLSSYSGLDVENCVVRKSGYHGIYLTQNSGTKILNSWIHNNGVDESVYYYGGAGIYFENQIGIPKVWNNTIYDNYTYGIESSQAGADPNILNCIISGNASNDLYRVGGSFNKVNYCLLQNSHAGTGNITGDPCFVNIGVDGNDLHIDETSQCKDAGDPNGDYGGETDIDGESRIYYGRVDIGGDEYYWSSADFDEDGFVNFKDYSMFAAVWQSEPNDAGYNDNCDLVNNNLIDVSDLAAFSEDWLWKKGWDDAWMMCMDGGGGSMLKSSVIMDRSLLSVSESSVVSSSVKKSCDGLMLGAVESLAKRPARFAAKSQKFYDITTATTITAKHKELDAVKAQAVSIKEVLKLLDEFWLAGEFDKALTEKEYKAFRDAIEKSDSF